MFYLARREYYLMLLSQRIVHREASIFMMKQQFYDVQTINQILKNNKKRRIVAIFKDYLIYDEVAEVITEILKIRESVQIISEVAKEQTEMKNRYQSFHQTPNYYSLTDVRWYLYENTVNKFQNYFEKIKSNNRQPLPII